MKIYGCLAPIPPEVEQDKQNMEVCDMEMSDNEEVEDDQLDQVRSRPQHPYFLILKQ